MTDQAPRISFIVTSYNYERYIGRTIESILKQTVQDFEIIVVDDASSDRSVDVIRGFGDPRIRVIVNQSNLGGSASYNRGVGASRGEWLAKLDSDDWIAPRKSELQLAAATADPRLDIIGTYSKVVDASGGPHPLAEEIEAAGNQPRDYQQVDCWIGENTLCRSSTMLRRSTHLRIGLEDPTLVRAPDYELWTRALREGCRFAVVAEPLTYLRIHSGNVTYGDPLETFLELGYAMLRNLMPLAEAHAQNALLERIVAYFVDREQLSALPPIEACRFLGILMTLPPVGDYAEFKAKLSSTDADPTLDRIGRLCLILADLSWSARSEAEKLERDGAAYAEAVEYWQGQSAYWERQSAYWRDQSGAWENAYRKLSENPFIARLLGARRWIRNRGGS